MNIIYYYYMYFFMNLFVQFKSFIFLPAISICLEPAVEISPFDLSKWLIYNHFLYY